MHLKRNLTLALLLPLLAVSAARADSSDLALPGHLSGRVATASSPLAFSSVYAFELAERSLEKAMTDADGRFLFEDLPAGLYKIIAYKNGFVPAIALITRATAEARQFLDLQLVEENAAEGGEPEGFWSVRSQIPGDVLRDIELASAPEGADQRGALNPAVLSEIRTEMQALAGMDERSDLGETFLTGGRVGIQGEIRDVHIGLTGDFRELEGAAGTTGDAMTSGRSQLVSLNVGAQSTGVRVTTLNNELTMPEDRFGEASLVNFERHRVDWSQPIGRASRSAFSAQYTEQNNFYSQGPIEPEGIPEASRSWRVEGSYVTSPSERAKLEAGFRYRERRSSYSSQPAEALAPLPEERVDLFGRGGLEVRPAVLVEFGLYSTMRDGSLSLVPSGGLVLRLGDNWRALTSGSFRVQDQDLGGIPSQDFMPELFSDYDTCEVAEQYCYRVVLARSFENGDDLSFGAIHRRFADTLQLYFNEDFFSQLESLFMVRGDDLPEVHFAMTRRLSPRVLTRLKSNLAAGGGGTFYSSDALWENQVRYLVTSADTHFESTSTGVFVAFHHLAQQLLPLGSRRRTAAPTLEMERLQLMLTQNLNALSRIASDWVLHLNMELSRRTSPDSTAGTGNELYKRLTGGVAVRF